MKSFVLEIDHADPAHVFARLQHVPYALFLDSADREHKAARYSFICAFPIETIEAKNGRITVSTPQEQTTYEGDPFAVLKDRIAAHKFSSKTLDNLPPFQGGTAGFFGYDLGRSIEYITPHAHDDPDMLDMAIGIYDQVVAFDHTEQKAWLITQAQSQTSASQKQNSLLEALKNPPQVGSFSAPHWHANFERKVYEERTARIIEYIREGDIFQANLSQRFDAELPQHFCAFAHYLNLRTCNPAPFATFMNLGNIKISSASPERFLQNINGAVETRPIKGTAPRSIDPTIDKENKTTLKNSEKDHAENTMIVDLLRNDLSKSCAPDSIEVTQLCALESFARVHHLVSTIKGTLHKNINTVDLLRGCFPGGSITGAPKIRAMEIIEKLEPTRRGPYCGAMGYIGFNGNMDTNILIRTLVYKKDNVSFQVGGGIVADSEPAAEYQETLDKADAIFKSFEQDRKKAKAS